MKKRIYSFSFVAALALLLGTLGWSGSLNAQSSPADQPQAQPSQTPSQQPPDTQAPDNQPPSSQAPEKQVQPSSESQTFSGTIVKTGDKYMLQDAASGTTYDLDRQEEVKKFEGKKVRVRGTLDANGKTIHMQ